MFIRNKYYTTSLMVIVLLGIGSIIFRDRTLFDMYDIFQYVNLILPASILIFSPKSPLKDLLFSLLVTFVLGVASLLWINYQNKPWFVPQDWSCDGPCYGWYTFEDNKEVMVIIHLGLSLSVGLAVRFALETVKEIVTRFRKTS